MNAKAKKKTKEGRFDEIGNKGIRTGHNPSVRIKDSTAGITLIALVITIIVLLILAGVAIATLTGENGILTQAGKAKTSNEEGEASDIFGLISNEWIIEKNTGNTNLEEFLKSKVNSNEIDSYSDNGNGTYTIKSNSYQTIIKENGEISDLFNPQEWDKTATLEACFIWESDNPNDGDAYHTIKGYTSKMQTEVKMKIPSRCTKIQIDAYGDYGNSRSFGAGIKTIEIPGTVTEIGDWAFAAGQSGTGFYSLENVIIPNSVIKIGNNAFECCENLRNISISNSVTEIGSMAFYRCTNLSNIDIPNSVTTIKYYAFLGCTSLSSITIPSSVTSIERGAFDTCTNLSSVTISSSVTSIEEYTFCKCTSLRDITIPSSVTSIGNWAFGECTSLSSIEIPSGVTRIEACAFSGCTSLSSITIPSSVTSIGSQAFYECTSLRSITIPSNVTSIGDGTFIRCTNLSSITIPNSVTSIGYYAFRYWTSSQTINVQGYTSAPSGWNSNWNEGCSATINWGQ